MAQKFLEKGYKLVGGLTQNHLIMLDLRSKNVNGT